MNKNAAYKDQKYFWPLGATEVSQVEQNQAGLSQLKRFISRVMTASIKNQLIHAQDHKLYCI